MIYGRGCCCWHPPEQLLNFTHLKFKFIRRNPICSRLEPAHAALQFGPANTCRFCINTAACIQFERPTSKLQHQTEPSFAHLGPPASGSYGYQPNARAPIPSHKVGGIGWRGASAKQPKHSGACVLRTATSAWVGRRETRLSTSCTG